MRRTPHACVVILAVLFAVSLEEQVQAAEWPERPVRLIVPFTAGSSSDTIARIVAARMGEQIGRQIVVENRVGGSTVIGTDAVAKSTPDGYTLGLANTTTHAVTAAFSAKLPFDPLRDFTPIGMIGKSPFILVGAPNLPINSLDELIKLAKMKPGSLSYASAGTGTLAHLAGELFKLRANIDIVHIPYRGTAQSVFDLMQGRIDLSVSTIPPTLQQIRERQIRALAVMAEKRNVMIPDVPTMAESGVLGCSTKSGTQGCTAELWTAMVVRSGVPSGIVGKLNQALNAAVNSREVQDALAIQGVDAEFGPAQMVSAAIKADIVKWRDIIVATKIAEPK
jgi:tripartite-type tricarboxylate transporter receptor subunit TctC